MEHLAGGSLEERLHADGPPPVDEALGWLEQAAARARRSARAGRRAPGREAGQPAARRAPALRVADFGIASAAGLHSLTLTGTVLGTAGYLSPEQARGERATPASDRYALAVVAYELLTGRRPFESESPTAEAAAHVQAEVPSISPQLDPVFRRALAKDGPERGSSRLAASWRHCERRSRAVPRTTRVLPAAGRRSPLAARRGHRRRGSARRCGARSSLHRRRRSAASGPDDERQDDGPAASSATAASGPGPAAAPASSSAAGSEAAQP